MVAARAAPIERVPEATGQRLLGPLFDVPTVVSLPDGAVLAVVDDGLDAPRIERIRRDGARGITEFFLPGQARHPDQNTSPNGGTERPAVAALDAAVARAHRRSGKALAVAALGDVLVELVVGVHRVHETAVRLLVLLELRDGGLQFHGLFGLAARQIGRFQATRVIFVVSLA